jgi:hypothetical protein
MLESKRFLAGRASVARDALREGRLRFAGSGFRRAAIDLGERLERLGVRRPYVEAVIVIRGDPQRRHEEEWATYVHGTELLGWLQERPSRLAAQGLDELRRALRELARMG